MLKTELTKKYEIPCLQFFIFNQKYEYTVTPEYEKIINKLSKKKTLYIHSSFHITLTRYYPTIPLLIKHILAAEKLGVKGIIIHLPREYNGGIYNIMKSFSKKFRGKSNVILYFEHIVSEDFRTLNQMIKVYRKMKIILRNFTVGLCFDTCHIFASGVELTTEKNIKDYFQLRSNDIKPHKLKNIPVLIHLNDSIGDFNSMIDRHGDIGTNIWKDDVSGLKKIISFGYDCIIEIKDPLESLNFILSSV